MKVQFCRLIKVLLLSLLALLFASCSLLFSTVEVTVYNADSETLSTFQYRDASSTGWKMNALSQPLKKGESAVFFMDKSRYDFLVMYSDQTMILKNNIDLRNIEIFTIIVDRGA